MLVSSPMIQLYEAEITKLDDSWDSLPSECPFWRLYWHESSGAYFESAEGREYIFAPKKIYIIPANLKGTLRLNGYPAQLYFHFSLLSPFTFLMNSLWSVPQTAPIQSVLTKCINVLKTSRDSKSELIFSAIALISLSLGKTPQKYLRGADRIDPRILRVLRILDESERGVNNAELAQTVSMAENSFIRLFSKEIGISPQKYSLTSRMNKARIMLSYDDCPIKEISEKLGFCDRYHFSREFKKAIKLTPKQYRGIYNINNRQKHG